MQKTREITKGELLEKYAEHAPIYFLTFHGDVGPDGLEFMSTVGAQLRPSFTSEVRLDIKRGTSKKLALEMIDKIRGFLADTPEEDLVFEIVAPKKEVLDDDLPF